MSKLEIDGTALCKVGRSVCLGGRDYLLRKWGGEFDNTAIWVAVAVNEDRYREVVGAAEGMKEDKANWGSFFQWMRGRGLYGGNTYRGRQVP